MLFSEARDEITALFNTAWLPKLVLFDNIYSETPAAKAPWARFSVRNTTSTKTSIGGNQVSYFGNVIIQIFVPAGNGLTLADSCVKIAIDAFSNRCTPSGIRFRNVIVNEVGPEGDWFQVNVTVSFEYDDFKS